jgi:hypothetical protein
MTEKIADLVHWQAFPAHPGYFLWEVVDKKLNGREPIIGWLVEQRRSSEKESYFWWGKPLVATAHDIDEYNYVIELPDGKIWFPEDRMCDSLEEAHQYLLTP